jgi:RNA polymerase sigma factor (sigma-70 family)
MDHPGSVTRLLDQLRSDDIQTRHAAAEQIWQRYFPDLLELARRRLHRRVSRREDAEDVLQNMYHSFCARQQRGGFTLDNRDDLWRLLVGMTLNKARKAVARHTRGKRNIHSEQDAAAVDGDSAAPGWALEVIEAADPTPEQAAQFIEEFEQRLRLLSEPLRQVALWKLQGYTNAEIAAPERLHCSERTVERKLELIRKAWQEAEAD